MPGARRSLASPVVSGVLCPCGSPRAGPATPASEAGGPGPGGRSLCGGPEHRRLHTLFQKLDVNRDGALCVHDLAVGLGQLGLHRTERDLWGWSVLPKVLKLKPIEAVNWWNLLASHLHAKSEVVNQLGLQ